MALVGFIGVLGFVLLDDLLEEVSLRIKEQILELLLLLGATSRDQTESHHKELCVEAHIVGCLLWVETLEGLSQSPEIGACQGL